MLHLHIIRYGESYDFKAEPDKPDSFSNANVRALQIIASVICCPEILFPTETALLPELLPWGASCLRGNFMDKSTPLRRQSILTDKKLTVTRCRLRKAAIRPGAGWYTIGSHFQKEQTQPTHGARAASFSHPKTWNFSIKHSKRTAYKPETKL